MSDPSQQDSRTYLDANASHPMLSCVRRRLADCLLGEPDAFSNPSSVHLDGQKAKATLFSLKQTLADILGVRDPEEFVINSGATEAINSCFHSFLSYCQQEDLKPHIVYSSIEHSAVVQAAQVAKATCHCIGVDSKGNLDQQKLLETFQEILAADEKAVILLCVQLANNEIGSCFDMAFQSKLWKNFGPKPIEHRVGKRSGGTQWSPSRYFTMLDGAQAFCKLDEAYLRVAMHFSDYLILSSHKVGGPTGIGALWVRPKSPYESLIVGGTQERRRRGGTHNTIGVVGFLAALEAWKENALGWRAKMARQRERLLEALRALPGVSVHGATKLALPNTVNFCVSSCPEESLVTAMDLAGISVSSGSACNSGMLKPSPVLIALGKSLEEALSSVRFSVGVESTDEEVDEFIDALKAKIAQIERGSRLAQELLPEIDLNSDV